MKHTGLVILSSQLFYHKQQHTSPDHWLHHCTRFPQRNRTNHKLSKYPRSPSMALLSIQIRPKSHKNMILYQNVMPKTYILRFAAYCFIFQYKKKQLKQQSKYLSRSGQGNECGLHGLITAPIWYAIWCIAYIQTKHESLLPKGWKFKCNIHNQLWKKMLWECCIKDYV